MWQFLGSQGLEKTQVCAAVDNQDLNSAFLAPLLWRLEELSEG